MSGVYRRPTMPADDLAPVTLETAWPLFGLRIRTARLVLRLATDEDLVALVALARQGIHPPDEMPFGIAWTRAPSPAFERGFLQYWWANRSGWSPEDWELNLTVLLDGTPVGTQSLHARRFASMRTVDTGSWVGAAYQRRGYGTEMRAAVLAFAFDHLAAEAAETEAYLDNAGSRGVSKALGYASNGVGRIAPEGVARETERFLMTAERWRSVPRPAIEVLGLDTCRDLFGG